MHHGCALCASCNAHPTLCAAWCSVRSIQHAFPAYNTQHTTRTIPTAALRSQNTVPAQMQHATRNHAPYNAQRASTQRTTYDVQTRSIPVQHGPFHHPRRQVSYTRQHATMHHQVATCPHTMQHRAYVHRAQHKVQHTTTHDATYNAPHATQCNTHNRRERRSRTAEERAMLPPLNSTDPPDIITTPPLCTPPLQSATAVSALPCNAYQCLGLGDRHRLERRAAAGHA